MLQADTPDDYVIATGESHSVREFLEEAFDLVGLDPYRYLKQSPQYMRPAEVNHLCGDYSKALHKLGWKPSVSFKALVKMMVDEDLELARREKMLLESGFRVGSRGTSEEYIPFD